MTDDYLRNSAYRNADPVNPSWDMPGIKWVHDWRGYVTEDVRAIWMDLDPDHRIRIAMMLQEIANAEEWD